MKVYCYLRSKHDFHCNIDVFAEAKLLTPPPIDERFDFLVVCANLSQYRFEFCSDWYTAEARHKKYQSILPFEEEKTLISLGLKPSTSGTS